MSPPRGDEVPDMTTKSSREQATSNGRFLFSSFTMARNGAMVVDREKLHQSEGYKRQIDALSELRRKRDEKR